MSNKKLTNWIIGGVVVLGITWLAVAGEVEYQDTDVREVDKHQLRRVAEALLEESESWPADMSDGNVAVASSMEPYEVRTIRYDVELDAKFEDVVAYLRNDNYSGPGRRDKPDKYEVTLYENGPHEWVRRSVHIAPPPGGDRDAVVLYFEDRPDPKTYRIAFQSVETLDGKPFPEVENTVRFKVMPSIIKIEETAPGRVRVRKVEAVDPRGSMSPLVNNYIISYVFFRSYMFDQAKAMRDTFEKS